MAVYSKDRKFTDFVHKSLAKQHIYELLGWTEFKVEASLLEKLDMQCGIDYVLKNTEEKLITVQERFRDCSYKHYNDFTLRYRRDYNIHKNRRESEYFKLKADFLVYGITNGSKKLEKQQIATDFLKYAVVNLKVLRQLFQQNRIIIPEKNQPLSSINYNTGILTAGKMPNKDQSSDFIIFDILQLNQLFGKENILICQKGFL